MNRNDIFLIHGTDYKSMAMEILDQAKVAEDIEDRNKTIALKPNLAVAKHPRSGATTHGELLEGVAAYLRGHGFRRIFIMEGSWVGDSTDDAFRAARYDRISQEYEIPLINLQKDTYSEYNASGMKLLVCDRAMSCDYMINMPVFKGHCQTFITCALKNNKGMIPNSEKRRYHTMGLHKPIAHLSTIVPCDFILVDNICGDLDFEEGGSPVVMNRVLGFRDPVLCDRFVCESMGYAVDDVPYIQLAERLGAGSADLSQANLIYLNHSEESGSALPSANRRVQKLGTYTRPQDACSACYGSLIYALERLEEQGLLRTSLPALSIGQGFRGKPGGIGIGQCTSCFQKTLAGCPPKAADMVAFLKKEWL